MKSVRLHCFKSADNSIATILALRSTHGLYRRISMLNDPSRTIGQPMPRKFVSRRKPSQIFKEQPSGLSRVLRRYRPAVFFFCRAHIGYRFRV